MSDLTQYRNQISMLGQTAQKAEDEQKYEMAFQCYQRSLDILQHMVKFEKNQHLIVLYKSKMEEYITRAEYIKKTVIDKSRSGSPRPQVPQENARGQNDLESTIVTEKPNVHWDDVSGLEGAKSALKEAVILPTRFPQLFDETRKPWRGILLYGPPGTGKSHLAKACATECDGTFFSVSSADLVSKWMGESEKQIKQLFEEARAKKPSIIFIDEIDSLCGSRSEGENDSSRRIKTEFLVQMQGTGTNNDGVLVLGATNVPWELDRAIRRRFQKRVYISLPEVHARAGIFKIASGKTKSTLTEQDYAQLGEASEGYSGSDIANVVLEALMLPVRLCATANKFKQIMDPSAPNGSWYLPTNPSDPEGQRMSLMEVPPTQLKAPNVSVDDYMEALGNVKPSVNEEDCEEHIKWTSEFGQDG